MTSLKTSIKTITYLSDTGCLEIQGASLLGLLNLHKKYSKARLNAACARALKTKVWRLSGIKSILEKGLDKQPVQDPKPDLLSTMEHENVRGSEYYH